MMSICEIKTCWFDLLFFPWIQLLTVSEKKTQSNKNEALIVG